MGGSVRRLIVIAMLAAVGAGCANGAGEPGPGGGAGRTVDSKRLDAYEAVIRHLTRPTRSHWNKIYVQIPLCEDAGAATLPKQCEQELTEREQAGLAARFVEDELELEFVGGYEEVGDRLFFGERGAAFVRMGPIQEAGFDLVVPASMLCGGKCGTGSIWIVSQEPEGWRVQGPAEGARVWIS
jgi:hypothetical protein